VRGFLCPGIAHQAVRLRPTTHDLCSVMVGVTRLAEKSTNPHPAVHHRPVSTQRLTACPAITSAAQKCALLYEAHIWVITLTVRRAWLVLQCLIFQTRKKPTWLKQETLRCGSSSLSTFVDRRQDCRAAKEARTDLAGGCVWQIQFVDS
jgi:hypothetical protein